MSAPWREPVDGAASTRVLDVGDGTIIVYRDLGAWRMTARCVGVESALLDATTVEDAQREALGHVVCRVAQMAEVLARIGGRPGSGLGVRAGARGAEDGGAARAQDWRTSVISDDDKPPPNTDAGQLAERRFWPVAAGAPLAEVPAVPAPTYRAVLTVRVADARRMITSREIFNYTCESRRKLRRIAAMDVERECAKLRLAGIDPDSAVAP